MRYSEALKILVKYLKEAGHDEAELDARYLMEDVSGFDRAAWFLHSEDSMPEDKEKVFFALGKRLMTEEPISYILGSREFMGLEFSVNKSVLIPRQDTELLVEEALNEIKNSGRGNKTVVSTAPCDMAASEYGKRESAGGGYRVLDLCTGSGCIAVSILKLSESLGISVKADASDISEKALSTAVENADKNNVCVNFIKSDMFENIDGKYDMIVSNPPYIPEDQYLGLSKRVHDYEPKLALCGGADGMDFYRIIASEAGHHLKQGGRLLLEIGFDQGETVPSLLEKNGFEQIEVKKDYNGLDRVVKAMRRS